MEDYYEADNKKIVQVQQNKTQQQQSNLNENQLSKDEIDQYIELKRKFEQSQLFDKVQIIQKKLHNLWDFRILRVLNYFEGDEEKALIRLKEILTQDTEQGDEEKNQKKKKEKNLDQYREKLDELNAQNQFEGINIPQQKLLKLLQKFEGDEKKLKQFIEADKNLQKDKGAYEKQLELLIKKYGKQQKEKLIKLLSRFEGNIEKVEKKMEKNGKIQSDDNLSDCQQVSQNLEEIKSLQENLEKNKRENKSQKEDQLRKQISKEKKNQNKEEAKEGIYQQKLDQLIEKYGEENKQKILKILIKFDGEIQEVHKKFEKKCGNEKQKKDQESVVTLIPDEKGIQQQNNIKQNKIYRSKRNFQQEKWSEEQQKKIDQLQEDKEIKVLVLEKQKLGKILFNKFDGNLEQTKVFLRVKFGEEKICQIEKGKYSLAIKQLIEESSCCRMEIIIAVIKGEGDLQKTRKILDEKNQVNNDLNLQVYEKQIYYLKEKGFKNQKKIIKLLEEYEGDEKEVERVLEEKNQKKNQSKIKKYHFSEKIILPNEIKILNIFKQIPLDEIGFLYIDGDSLLFNDQQISQKFQEGHSRKSIQYLINNIIETFTQCLNNCKRVVLLFEGTGEDEFSTNNSFEIRFSGNSKNDNDTEILQLLNLKKPQENQIYQVVVTTDQTLQIKINQNSNETRIISASDFFSIIKNNIKDQWDQIFNI